MLIAERSILFVHVPKVAGQSIENLLLAAIGKQRVEHGPDYLLRKNNDPNQGPPRLAHLTVAEYTRLGYLQADELDRYFKFGFVRNPWDRVVSFYRYSGLSALIDFEDFVLVYLERLLRDNYWFYRPQTDFLFSDNNERLVDFIGRFEHLELDWKTCATRIGDIPDVLPKDNYSKDPKLFSRKSLTWLKKYPDLLFRIGRSKAKVSNYQDYYTTASKRKVSQVYQRDIELLAYKFTGQ